MERDYENHARWKHKWEWHNRENVWDRIATEWAGKEDFDEGTKMKICPPCTEKEQRVWKKLRTRHRGLGAEDTTVHARVGGPTVQLCGDSTVACTWISGQMFTVTEVQRTDWSSTKDPVLLVDKEDSQSDFED